MDLLGSEISGTGGDLMCNLLHTRIVCPCVPVVGMWFLCLKVWSDVAADLENKKKEKKNKEVTCENQLQVTSENKQCVCVSNVVHTMDIAERNCGVEVYVGSIP